MKEMFLEMIMLLFGFILNLFLFGFTKTKTGVTTAPRAPKLSYFDGRAPQLSARVNHRMPATGVIGIMYMVKEKSRIFFFFPYFQMYLIGIFDVILFGVCVTK